MTECGKMWYRRATDENIMRLTRFACWIAMATHTHIRKAQYLLPCHDNGYANETQRYGKPKLPVLL